MKIHLVTYATPRFRLRQYLLGLSARLNGVVDTVTSWTPEMLLQAGFEERCKNIKLIERGSGYWAWKPFVIEAKLREVPEGDLVFYCDVGRRYPFKQLTDTLAPFLDWMESKNQPMLPGLLIPWKGPMSMWTKRDAFLGTDMDRPDAHAAIPIQASFSLWRANDVTRSFVGEWMTLASDRNLISDDPSSSGTPELPDFHDHRHDQALLTLCCLKHGFHGLDLGNKMPSIDTQHPCEIASLMMNVPARATVSGRMLKAIVWPLETLEAKLRSNVSFGKPLPEPTNPPDLS